MAASGKYVAAIAVMAMIWTSLPGLAFSQAQMTPGSWLFWHNHDSGMNTSYTAKVLASGEDFVLYEPDYDDASDDVSSEELWVEFSGIHVRFCNEDMPTADDRAALAAMWPLEEGATLRIESDDPVEITVGEVRDFFLMGGHHPTQVVTATYEDFAETYLVLLDRRMTAEIQWDEGGFDRLMLVSEPGASVAAIEADEARLGTCASLIG